MYELFAELVIICRTMVTFNPSSKLGSKIKASSVYIILKSSFSFLEQSTKNQQAIYIFVACLSLKMYLIKTPSFIQSLFPNFTWRIPQHEQTIYLTFDDGPIPEVTEWVLDILYQYQAKATFFCVGENVQKYPEIFQRIKAEKHAVGNHTFHHKNGWQTERVSYFHDVRKCAELVDSNLFRPPYGKMTPKQAQFLQRHYQIIMWDILTGDFDPTLNPDTCFRNIINKTKPGSILVFHDSLKAKPILYKVLPKVLDHFSKLGFRFDSISSNSFVQRTNNIAI